MAFPKPKKASVLIFDQYKKLIIEIKLERVDEDKITWVLETMPHNPFSEGWFTLFAQQLSEKFEKIGAIGINIERLDLNESKQDSVCIAGWAIKIIGNSPLNKFMKNSKSNITKDSLSEVASIKEYLEDMDKLIKRNKTKV